MQEKSAAAPGSIRELLGIALPLILSSGSATLMHVVDRMFLTWFSRDALAAAMPAAMLQWTVLSVPLGMAMYVNTFVAQYEGAGRFERVGAAVWQSVYFSIAAGAVVLLGMPFAGSLFAAIGHSPALQALESEYFAVLSAGAIPTILAAALSGYFSGRGRTVVVMWANLLGSLVNIVFDYLWIFGWGPFPRGGMAGAAWATNLGQAVMCVFYIVLMARGAEAVKYGLWSGRRIDRELFGRLLVYGGPNGFHLLADVCCFSAFILLVGLIGPDVMAATSLAFSLNTLAFLPMIGVSTAVATLVGQRIGELRPELAVRTTWLAFSVSAAYMGSFALVYLFLPDVIIWPYAWHSDAAQFQAMRPIVIELLRFVAVYSLFDAMALIFGSAIRGAGDTRFTLVYSLLSGVCVMLLPAWIAYKYFHGGLHSAWIACTAYVMVLGVGFLLRFQQGAWQSMRVIEELPVSGAVASVETPATVEPDHARSGGTP